MQQSSSLGDSLLIHPALLRVVAPAHRRRVRDLYGVSVRLSMGVIPALVL